MNCLLVEAKQSLHEKDIRLVWIDLVRGRTPTAGG